MLRIFLQAVEGKLKACSPEAPTTARFGAITLAHRFGAALNANCHFHCCIIDGVFSAEAEEGRFDEIPPCISPLGALRASKFAPGKFITRPQP